ncbi:DUF6292 family protein [Kutzneria kofuensis]|jgi:hypothetical protein|uniref:DUF6292 domain-containing protein n=1 Tax=Kutzneria kofuensis TaxID=103725 RepID=A0A7W9NF75_9PSEU|nr:DUF6292 family protein [Kutzneria kofuensis]MBB5890405.1 hypothetical protein [Kutzneria kofuensis]
MSKVHADAQQVFRTQQALAARTVADHAVDAADRGTLLEMLGLVDEDSGPDDVARALTLGLSGYLRAVADAVGESADGTSCEVSDTATAYIGLTRRGPRSGRDLMLVWSERDGWAVLVETDPTESPIVVSRFGGDDPAPAPWVVARFVADTLTGVPAQPQARAHHRQDRRLLADRLARYAAPADFG